MKMIGYGEEEQTNISLQIAMYRVDLLDGVCEMIPIHRTRDRALGAEVDAHFYGFVDVFVGHMSRSVFSWHT